MSIRNGKNLSEQEAFGARIGLPLYFLEASLFAHPIRIFPKFPKYFQILPILVYDFESSQMYAKYQLGWFARETFIICIVELLTSE